MIKNNNKKRDLLQIVKNLDITLEMFNYANSKYKSIATYLTSKGIDAEFYPQGSFALGTTVRPYKDDKKNVYDLDAICQTTDSKVNTAPSDLKEKIENILQSGELNKSGFSSFDECCTLEFSDISGCEFSIDVVTSVEEGNEEKSELKNKSNYPALIDTAIAIPKQTPKSYRWLTNNPRGYKSWFDSINQKFLEANPIVTREAIAEQSMNQFSVEEIDPVLERTALQIVIKILKRHRDVYFSRKADGESIRPLSAIITTLVTSIAEYADPYAEVVELLEYVLDELSIYSMQQRLTEAEFSQAYVNKKIVTKSNGKWTIENPANPEDNLADAWNSNPELVKSFFEWINVVTNDFGDIELSEGSKYISTMSNSFGSDIVERSIKFEDYDSKYQPPSEFSPSQKSSPYKE